MTGIWMQYLLLEISVQYSAVNLGKKYTDHKFQTILFIVIHENNYLNTKNTNKHPRQLLLY